MLQKIPDAKLDVMEIDLNSFASVRNFAAAFIATGLPLNILVNNAGIMSPPYTLSKDNLHGLWLKQAQQFFNVKSGDRLLFLLLQLKELGSTAAFNCLELESVFCEVEKIERWRQNCKDIVGLVGNVKPLINALSEIKSTVDRSLHIYDKSNGWKQRKLCMCCFGELKDQKLFSCSVCNDL